MAPFGTVPFWVSGYQYSLSGRLVSISSRFFFSAQRGGKKKNLWHGGGCGLRVEGSDPGSLHDVHPLLLPSPRDDANGPSECFDRPTDARAPAAPLCSLDRAAPGRPAERVCCGTDTRYITSSVDTDRRYRMTL